MGIGSPPGLLRSLCMYIHAAIKKYSEDIQESDEHLPLVICGISARQADVGLLKGVSHIGKGVFADDVESFGVANGWVGRRMCLLYECVEKCACCFWFALSKEL